MAEGCQNGRGVAERQRGYIRAEGCQNGRGVAAAAIATTILLSSSQASGTSFKGFKIPQSQWYIIIQLL